MTKIYKVLFLATMLVASSALFLSCSEETLDSLPDVGEEIERPEIYNPQKKHAYCEGLDPATNSPATVFWNESSQSYYIGISMNPQDPSDISFFQMNNGEALTWCQNNSLNPIMVKASRQE